MLIRASLVPPEEAVDELWHATSLLRKVPGVVASPRDELDIPITSFGNLVPQDCARLATKLRSAFEGADAPVVWFKGLRLEDDASIALGLAGDVEPVAELARFVPEVAETMGLYVDRRRFRPRIAFATAAPDAPVALLQSALAGLAEWTGEPWPVPGLSLLRTRWIRGKSSAEEFDLIELAEPADASGRESIGQ